MQIECNGATYTIEPGADLRGANLRGADLRGADLQGAYLRDAKGYVCLGTDQRGYHFYAVQWDDGWRISAGCRWFTLAEAKAHWEAKGNNDALARLAILDAHPCPTPDEG